MAVSPPKLVQTLKGKNRNWPIKTAWFQGHDCESQSAFYRLYVDLKVKLAPLAQTPTLHRHQSVERPTRRNPLRPRTLAVPHLALDPVQHLSLPTIPIISPTTTTRIISVATRDIDDNPVRVEVDPEKAMATERQRRGEDHFQVVCCWLAGAVIPSCCCTTSRASRLPLQATEGAVAQEEEPSSYNDSKVTRRAFTLSTGCSRFHRVKMVASRVETVIVAMDCWEVQEATGSSRSGSRSLSCRVSGVCRTTYTVVLKLLCWLNAFSGSTLSACERARSHKLR